MIDMEIYNRRQKFFFLHQIHLNDGNYIKELSGITMYFNKSTYRNFRLKTSIDFQQPNVVQEISYMTN